MKMLSLILLSLALATLPGDAARLKGFKQLRAFGDSSGTACGLKLQDGETYNISEEFSLGVYQACRFTTTSGFTLCSVDLRLDTTPGNNGTLDVAIYSDNGDQPGTIVGSFSPTLSSSTVTGDAFYTFNPVATVSSTTTYWLVIRSSRTDVNVLVPSDNVGESPKDCMFSGDGTSWTDEDVNSVFNYRLNGL